MQIIYKSNILIISLLSLAAGSQLVKQGWLANTFDPQVYAGWATAVLASQLLFNFGGLGFHNFSARKSALYESRGKSLLTNSLISKQLFIYTYLLPLSIPVIYFLVSKPDAILFSVMLFYSFVNVLLNAATIPIYVRNSFMFSSIQSKRGMGSAAIAIGTCLVTDSLIFTILNESFFILILGILTLKSHRLKWSNKTAKFSWDCKALIPFFIPVVLSTISVSLSRLIAIEVLNDKSLGIYYFIFLLVSFGVIFQYGLSVFFGPIITSKLETNSKHNMFSFIFKCWISLFFIALIIGLFSGMIFPFFVKYFFQDYLPGLVLIFPMLCLAISKICDIWSVYFLLGGFEKYLYLPHLVSILIAILIYFAVVKADNISLNDMRYFLFGEAFAIFFVPLILFIRERLREPSD